MNEQDNVELIKRFVALFNTHDIDSYLKFYDESYVGESELGPPICGSAGIRQRDEALFSAFPDFHLDVEQILAAGDHVVATARLSGTHKGKFLGIAPTNKQMTWNACSVAEIRGGKTVRTRLYSDHARLFEQLGVLSMPGSTAAA